MAGIISTANQTAANLREQNRDYYGRKTWENLFVQNQQQAMAAENQLIKNYGEQTAQAYLQYLQNKNAIQTSQIVGAGKQELLSQQRLALQDAYNTYSQGLAQGQSEIATAAAQQESAITEALYSDAEYTNLYEQAHYDYLAELYKQYEEGENKLFDEELWQQYLAPQIQATDDKGNLLYIDEEGNITTEETDTPSYEDRRLMTRSELMNMITEPVYDEEGNLTNDYLLNLKGIDFYDLIENRLATVGEGMSFGEYLSETNPELYNWSTSYNPYDYTEDGTRAGTFKTMTGRASTDYLYSFAERAGGMEEGQIKEMFAKFEEASTELGKLISESGRDLPEQAFGQIDTMVNEIHTLAKDLGIDKDLESQMGMTWEQFTSQITNYANETATGGEMAGAFFGDVVHDASVGTTIGSGVGAGVGAVLGAVAGSVVPGVGTAVGAGVGASAVAGVGAIAGAIVGGIVGIIRGFVNMDNQRNTNKRMAELSKQSFDNIVNVMTQYALQTRRNADINSNKVLY